LEVKLGERIPGRRSQCDVVMKLASGLAWRPRGGGEQAVWRIDRGS